MARFKCFTIIFLTILSSRGVKALELNSENAILMDYDSSEILYKKKADDIVAPASSTKIMTAYVIFSLLGNEIFSRKDKFKVSIRAWRQDGTRMLLEPEWKISVDDLLMGMLVASANDAAITLAEGSLGTIQDFVGRMNSSAKGLGLMNTHFENPTGLYERTHYMSVGDMALLTRALVKNYGEYYSRYFSQQSFTFGGMLYKNKNLLSNDYGGVDGLSFGYSDQGKYTAVLSARKNGKRLIVVIAHADSEKKAIEDMKILLNYGFSQYRYVELFRKGELVKSMDAFFSRGREVRMYTKQDIIYVVKNSRLSDLKIRLVHSKYIFRPIKKDSVLAKLTIVDGDQLSEYDLYAENEVRRPPLPVRYFNLFLYNFRRLTSFGRNENPGILERQQPIVLQPTAIPTVAAIPSALPR